MTMMTMMRQFTIRLRMLGAIAMVLALLSMLGLGGLWGMGQIKDQSDDFLHHSFAEVQHLSHLRGALAMVRMAEKDMIIEYERPNEVEKAYTRWKQNLAETEKVANGFLEGEEDPDNVVVRELVLRLQSYAKLFEPIAVQLKSSGYESATTANRMSQKALAEFVVIDKQVSELEVILNREVEESVQDQQKVAEVVRWVFVAALAVASLVVVPLTILNMNSICQPLEQARLLAQAIAGGDLSQRVVVHGKDEVADLQRTQQAMQDGLSALVSQVRNASESVATASQEIASGNQDLSVRTEKSASSVQDTVGSLAELTENVQQTAHAAQTARQLSDSAYKLAARGGQVVTQAVGSMHEIAASSSKINDIVGLIDSIAFQTNILALNAAVEAARAGEQGRGFAVVASEVRMLAKRSAAAAQEIKGLVSTSVHAVDGGVKLVEEAGAAMKEMVDGVQRRLMAGADQPLATPAAISFQGWCLALALSLGAAVSLGITRFAYGLLLPAMRTDLGWSYTLAGAMNTANALGYLIGALWAPRLLRTRGPGEVLWRGAVLASVFMGLSGFFTDTTALLAQRLLAGVASALVFVAGGLLAARLGARFPRHNGLLLGMYYGGTGVGIVLSALMVPWLLEAFAAQPHGWQWSWWALALACAVGTAVLVWPARVMSRWALPGAPAGAGGPQQFHWRDFRFGLAGYTFFGVGYIGYMTFVVALLRSQGTSAAAVTVFYALLGAAVIASSRIWAGLLDKHQDGRPLATLNTLLGVAIVLPALTQWWPALLASGLLFGAVFLSVVASTTALVRHNLPPTAWAAGISAFTTVFAAGQIVGPTVVGWIADGPGGLARGLVFSAAALWVGAALAIRQKAL